MSERLTADELRDWRELIARSVAAGTMDADNDITRLLNHIAALQAAEAEVVILREALQYLLTHRREVHMGEVFIKVEVGLQPHVAERLVALAWPKDTNDGGQNADVAPRQEAS